MDLTFYCSVHCIKLQHDIFIAITVITDDMYVKTYRSYKVFSALLIRVEQSVNAAIQFVTDMGIIKVDFNTSRNYLGSVNFNK